MSVQKDRSLTRRVLAIGAIITAAANASPLYLAAVSEQTASDAAWRAVSETLAARYGTSAFHVDFVARLEEVMQAEARPPRLTRCRLARGSENLDS